MQPKIKIEEKDKSKKEIEESEKNAKNYWEYIQNTKMLTVADTATYILDDGIIIVPVDNIGRPILDSTLFFTKNALIKLTEAIDKIIE